MERNEAVVNPAQVFTETIFQCSGYNKVIGTIRTDQSGTLELQFGWDEVNWDWIEQVPVDILHATTAVQPGAYAFRFAVVSSKLRVVYTHGPNQGFVRYGIYTVPI